MMNRMFKTAFLFLNGYMLFNKYIFYKFILSDQGSRRMMPLTNTFLQFLSDIRLGAATRFILLASRIPLPRILILLASVLSITP